MSDGQHPPDCPVCGSAEMVLPILYGDPGDEMMEMAQDGLCMLGGCMIWEENPTWYCRKCEDSFGRFGNPEGL